MAQVAYKGNVAAREPAASRKALGLWAAMALVVGNMIGSGIFLLPSSLAPYGGISILGWIFTAVGALFLALVFAKLASLVPKVGGPYAYTRLGFGDFAGFWIGWGYWISVWCGNAAIAVALVSYLGSLPGFSVLKTTFWLSALVAIGLIWLVTWINVMGVKNAGIFQTITTIMKLVPLVAFATIGLFYVDWSHFVPFNASGETPFVAITAVAALTLWSFLGVESATIPADDVTNPKKTIPRATVLGTIVTALVYILSAAAVMGILPLAELAKSGAPYADAAQSVWGQWAFYVVVIGAVISCLGTLNGFTLIQGQVPMAAARDRLFPKVFGKVSRHGVPALGIVISSLLVTVLTLLNYWGQTIAKLEGSTTNPLLNIFNSLILLAGFTALVPYAFSAMSELVLFIKNRAEFSGKRLFGSSVIAVIAFAYSMWTIYGAGAETVLLGFLMLLLGVPVYVWLRKEQADEAQKEPVKAAEEQPAVS